MPRRAPTPFASPPRFRRTRGGTVLGLLLGVAVGALIALAAAWYVTRHSPFRANKAAPPPSPTAIPQELLGLLRQVPPPTPEGAPAPAPPVAKGAAPTLPAPLPAGTPPATPSRPAGETAAAPSGMGGAPASSAAAAANTVTAAPPAPHAPPSAAERWFWQVGAFGSEQEANRVRVELALLGVTSAMEPTRMPDGRTLYRVRVGPYPSQQAAEAARGRLQAAGYQPVLVRG